MKFLSDEQLRELQPAETSSFPSPVPTQIVSSDEYMPVPQSAKQREVEARLKELSDRLARRQGLSRRRFFQTASGMAASFLVMNQVFGRIFEVERGGGGDTGYGGRACRGAVDQFVIDGHTHFLRDDTRLMGFIKAREAVGKAGWNKAIGDKEQTIDDLKYANYIKEIYMDSDTKVALLSNSPSEVPEDWFIPQEQVFKTREQVNKEAGTRRMMAHFHDHPGLAGLARPGRQSDRGLQARFMEGLHGRRQHPQRARPLSLSSRRREADVSVLREGGEVGHQERLHPQGTIRARRRGEIPAATPLCRCQRCRQGGQGLAAAQLPDLPLRLSLDRRHPGRGHGGVRQDRTQLMDQRSRRDPGEIRRHQRLWRSGPALRLDRSRRAAPRGGVDGHAGQGARRRSRAVGHRRGVDRRAAVADRGAAPPRDPGGYAEEIRLPAAGAGRWSDQDRGLRRQHGTALQFRQAGCISENPTASPNSKPIM